MLEKIKKIQGINHNEFDDAILGWIQAAEIDLKSIGIVDTLVNNPDSLVEACMMSYVLGQLDVENSERYLKSYELQKDALRHTTEYIVESFPNAI